MTVIIKKGIVSKARFPGFGVGLIQVEDEIAGSNIAGENFGQLSDNPPSRRVEGYIYMEKHPPSVINDDKDIQHPESYRGNSEEIHGDDGVSVIIKKSFPLFDFIRACRSSL